MDKNRPTSRKKNVTGGSSSVNKTGSGLGSGPVGNSGGHGSSSGGHTQLSGGGSGRRAGTRAGGIGLGGVAVLVILFLLKSFMGGGSQTGTSDLYDLMGQTQGQQYQESTSDTSTAASTTQADMTVAAGARDKRIAIKGGGADTITIMVYMCGTDLESKSGMATNDLNEMLQATLSDKVNLLVYTGGCKGWRNNVISSGKNQIYQIKDGKFICLEDNVGTGAMVDPSTLTDFIRYCTKNYPADRNELIFWDHGGGSITGYGYDEKNPSAGSMNLAGIDTALSNAGVYFDFIGFDTCLMATVENGFMLEQYADYMIASEETEPGVGWYYTNWLTKLASNTSMPTVEIGKNIIDDFVDECNRKCRGQKTTLSVVDLAELKATVPDELTEFARSTNDLIKNNEYKKVSNARKNTREFAQSSQIDQIDLVHFCENIDNAEARNLAKALEGAIKYNRTSASMTDAHGLAIYFPYQKTGKVSNALNLFKKIGMDNEYSKCIQQFASTQTAGQMAAGGVSNPYSSLSGSLLGGGSISQSSSGSSDMIMSMLSGMLSGGSSGTSASSYGFDPSVLDLFMGRDISNQDTADYISENYLNADNLVWTDSEGTYKLIMDEEQWDLVQDIELNVFVDDGEGYIDLGLDNVFEFDENGNLYGEYDGTWLALDGQVVPYYHMDTINYSDSYTITGYVPCFLNGERAELLITFDSENPDGYIAGARYVYADAETEAVAKNIEEVKAGDVVEPICDYYTYDGEYSDSYRLDARIVLSDNTLISNVAISGSPTKANYRVTDIYNQKYWTPTIP